MKNLPEVFVKELVKELPDINEAKLFWPGALEWMWNYCTYLCSKIIVEPNGFTHKADIGIYAFDKGTHRYISKACVVGPEPGDYYSGEMVSYHSSHPNGVYFYKPDPNNSTNMSVVTWDIVNQFGLIPDYQWRCSACGCSYLVPDYNTTCGNKDCVENAKLFGSVYEEDDLISIQVLSEIGKCSILKRK